MKEEAIKTRLKGLKNKLKRVRTTKENEKVAESYQRRLVGQEDRLEEEIKFLEYLLE